MEEFLALATETLSPVGHKTLALSSTDCREHVRKDYRLITIGSVVRTRTTKVGLTTLAELTFTTFGSVKRNNMVALAK